MDLFRLTPQQCIIEKRLVKKKIKRGKKKQNERKQKHIAYAL